MESPVQRPVSVDASVDGAVGGDGPGRSRATLAVIASEAGVSAATVSKVLNGRADVARHTRERVEKLLRSHNYSRPGPRRARRSGLVDLVIAGLDSPWAVEILRGLEAECYQRGIGVVVSRIREGDARPPSWVSLPSTHDSDGVILVTSRIDQGQYAELQRTGAALVVVDPVDLPAPDIASVGATNWAGGLAATEHLISLGHRRIAVIGGPQKMLCTQARIDGYRAGLQRAGITVDDDLIRYGDFHHEGGFGAARTLLAREDTPTAIFAGSDQQALGVYEAARQGGLSIPRDLSVVGFDDLPLCQWVSPPMTTVRQPLEEMGRIAARTLFQLLDGETLVTSRVELATELKVRLSTAPPPQ